MTMKHVILAILAIAALAIVLFGGTKAEAGSYAGPAVRPTVGLEEVLRYECPARKGVYFFLTKGHSKGAYHALRSQRCEEQKDAPPKRKEPEVNPCKSLLPEYGGGCD